MREAVSHYVEEGDGKLYVSITIFRAKHVSSNWFVRLFIGYIYRNMTFKESNFFSLNNLKTGHQSLFGNSSFLKLKQWNCQRHNSTRTRRSASRGHSLLAFFAWWGRGVVKRVKYGHFYYISQPSKMIDRRKHVLQRHHAVVFMTGSYQLWVVTCFLTLVVELAKVKSF